MQDLKKQPSIDFPCGCKLYHGGLELKTVEEPKYAKTRFLRMTYITQTHYWDAIAYSQPVLLLCKDHRYLYEDEKERRDKITKLEAEIRKLKVDDK